MAKKKAALKANAQEGMSKTQFIKAYLQEHPKAEIGEALPELQKTRPEIKTSDWYNAIRSKGGKATGKKRGRKPKGAAPTPLTGEQLASMTRARAKTEQEIADGRIDYTAVMRFALKIGGIDQAIAALERVKATL